jgi:hypothetical protein
MPSGSVVEYAGKRGVVWRIRYRDATGAQVTETVGAAQKGVTRKQAEAALRDRVVKVEQKGWARRPAPTTFADYAGQWFRDGPAKRRWKPATIAAYVYVERRLVDGFGSMPVGAIRPRHVAAWVASHELGPSSGQGSRKGTGGYSNRARFRPSLRASQMREHAGCS